MHKNIRLKSKRMKQTNYDSPWKNVLRYFLQAFMELCFADVAQAIDWTKEYAFLDKELQAISRQQEIGQRIADALCKVWLKNGAEIWLLLHIEIQAREEDNFPERMYIYHYRIFDRYHKSPISIAVLADDALRWRPSVYQHVSLYHKNKLQFEFATVKLLDYVNQMDTLRHHHNPFAIVIWAHLESLKTRKKDKKRLNAKIAVTRALYEQGYSKAYILDLYAFIDWVLALPEPLELEYMQTIEQLEEEKQMQYITSAERIGIQKGIQQGEAAILMRQLQRRFGEIPTNYAKRIQQADANTLLALGDKILDAQQLSDLFENIDINNG